MSYAIFVPPATMRGHAPYEEEVNWAFANSQHENVELVTVADIYTIRRALDIINEENNDWIRDGENGWVTEPHVQQAILERLIPLVDELPIARGRELTAAIIRLLRIAIDTRQEVHFLF